MKALGFEDLKRDPAASGEAVSVRQKLWIGVAIATARSDACVDVDTPGKYANRALVLFDRAFKTDGAE